MLPVVDEMVSDDINDAHAQLTLLSKEQAEKEIFTNDHLQQLIDTYEEKSTQAHTLKEQCRLWRNTQHLSEQQKEMLSSLDTNLVKIEKVSQQILTQLQKLIHP